MQSEQNKKLTPSTRCIENLNVDTGFTKTGLLPDKYAEYEAEQKARIEAANINVLFSKREADFINSTIIKLIIL